MKWKDGDLIHAINERGQETLAQIVAMGKRTGAALVKGLYVKKFFVIDLASRKIILG
jgi:hypothetical protein